MPVSGSSTTLHSSVVSPPSASTGLKASHHNLLSPEVEQTPQLAQTLPELLPELPLVVPAATMWTMGRGKMFLTPRRETRMVKGLALLFTKINIL